MTTIILQWNARSVVAHHPFLKRHISTSATIPDAICIQETFLHDQLMFAMKNYDIERLDSPAGARGSIATLIRTGISYSVLSNPTNMEALIVRLMLSTGDLTVVNVHHRPSDNITDYVISDYRNAYIILSDFNAYSTLFVSEILQTIVVDYWKDSSKNTTSSF